MSFEIQIDRGINGLERLADSWALLAADSTGRHFFESWWYYRACLSALDDSDERFLFVSVVDCNKVRVILPLEEVFIRRAGMPIKSLGSPQSIYVPYWDWIGDPATEGGRILATVLDWARSNRELVFDIMHIGSTFEDSSFRTAVDGLMGRHGLVREKVPQCNYLYCGESQNPFANISKNFRGNLRKARNKLRELPAVSFESTNVYQGLQVALARFVDLEASGWKGAKASAIRDKPEVLRFYEHLVSDYPKESEGSCQINELFVDGQTIASQFCLRMRDTVYILKIAYDEAFKRVAPGNMLLEWLIEKCCEDSSTRYLSFVSDSAWHEDWNPLALTCEEVKIYGSSALGRAFWLRNFGSKMWSPKK